MDDGHLGGGGLHRKYVNERDSWRHGNCTSMQVIKLFIAGGNMFTFLMSPRTNEWLNGWTAIQIAHVAFVKSPPSTTSHKVNLC